MTVLKVEVVVGAIEVSRHDGNVVAAVLYAETLAHLKSGNLCNGVWLIGVFQFVCKQFLFLHRLPCHARIDTCGTEEEKFPNPVTIAFANDVLLYLQILINEIGTIPQVRHYPAHMGSGENHGIRLFLIEKVTDCDRVEQVEFLV